MNPLDRVLIVGHRGMLAQALASALDSRGIAHAGVDRDTCDITSPDSVAQIFREHHPTLVLNCAAYTAVDKCEVEPDAANAVNGIGVGHLASASRAGGAMLVHYSTDYVFDSTLRRPLRPDDPVGPKSAYGRSKLLGEQLLQSHAPDRWMILRTAWLYGPGGPSFPATMLRVAREGKPLTVVNDQFGSPTFTHDLAAATLNLITAGGQGILHLTNSGQTNWFEFARAIFETFGITPASLNPITSDDW
ncbi:MAG TPA: dTDP-4-dehydrorhamnose reductase, partial [Tepidisphaeraceae bacterium]|nr:dTDP-4-dehydrorhamnose reductase [Tepidisphaeraceae bacterium]